MNKKIILVDMDGTICQYDEKLLRIAHERFGLPLYKPEEAKHFNTHSIFPTEYHERVDEIANEEGFFKDMKPYPNAVEAMAEMASHSELEVYICTSPKKHYRNAACAGEKHMWISRYLGRKWTERVILTRDKTLVHGHVLIDDKPEITGVHTPSWVHVYHDRPYNQVIIRPRITDWSKWKEILLPILFP